MNAERREKLWGWTKILTGAAGLLGGMTTGVAAVSIEVIQLTEARAFSAMTRLGFAAELDPVTAPLLVGSVGLVGAGVVLVGVGNAHLQFAELIHEIDSIPTQSA